MGGRRPECHPGRSGAESYDDRPIGSPSALPANVETVSPPWSRAFRIAEIRDLRHGGCRGRRARRGGALARPTCDLCHRAFRASPRALFAGIPGRSPDPFIGCHDMAGKAELNCPDNWGLIAGPSGVRRGRKAAAGSAVHCRGLGDRSMGRGFLAEGLGRDAQPRYYGAWWLAVVFASMSCFGHFRVRVPAGRHAQWDSATAFTGPAGRNRRSAVTNGAGRFGSRIAPK